MRPELISPSSQIRLQYARHARPHSQPLQIKRHQAFRLRKDQPLILSRARLLSLLASTSIVKLVQKPKKCMSRPGMFPHLATGPNNSEDKGKRSNRSTFTTRITHCSTWKLTEVSTIISSAVFRRTHNILRFQHLPPRSSMFAVS